MRRPKRGTHRHFSASNRATREQQIRQVHAGDQQDQPDRPQQHIQERPRIAHRFFFQCPEVDVQMQIGYGCISRLNARDHAVHIHLCLREAQSRLQARHKTVVVVFSFRVLLYLSKAHGDPEITMAQAAGVQWEFEAPRHHSDNRVWTPIEIDRLAQYAWIAVESFSP
jgi:hypothetical protein